MNYEINVTIFVQGEDAKDAFINLASELDYLCDLDNQILAVEYPPIEEVKESTT